MTKAQFLDELCKNLAGFPPKEAEERLRFYTEMIDDRMEEGFSEEDAVAAAGSADDITAQIAADLSASPAPIPEEKTAPAKRRRKAWQIVLLALGSPLWLSLLIAAAAVAFCLYVSAWAVVVSFWAAFGSVVACIPAAFISGIVFIAQGNLYSGLFMIAAGFVCAGLAILLFFGCKALSKGTCLLTKKVFQRKEMA